MLPFTLKLPQLRRHVGIYLGSTLKLKVLHDLDLCYPGISLLPSYSYMGSRNSASPKETYRGIGLLKIWNIQISHTEDIAHLEWTHRKAERHSVSEYDMCCQIHAWPDFQKCLS